MSNSRGKNPATLQHEWVMIATFAVGQNEVDQLAAARVDPSGQGRHNVELTQDKMTSLDGPGCKICGLEWTIGYGEVCKGSPDITKLGLVPPPPAQPQGQMASVTTLPKPGGLQSGPTSPLPVEIREPEQAPAASGLILPNGQQSSGGGLFLPEGVEMPPRSDG